MFSHMYLSKLSNTFVQIMNHICPNYNQSRNPRSLLLMEATYKTPNVLRDSQWTISWIFYYTVKCLKISLFQSKVKNDAMLFFSWCSFFSIDGGTNEWRQKSGKCENLFVPPDNFDPRHSSQNEKGRCYSFPEFLIIQDEKFN